MLRAWMSERGKAWRTRVMILYLSTTNGMNKKCFCCKNRLYQELNIAK